MQEYKQEFIRFLVEQGALKFGSFTLKSGRRSPYFVNVGDFADGASLRRLGGFYARRIREGFGEDFDLLYGPAYKGIALALSAAQAFDELFGRTVPFSFNRKEAKGHGDRGFFVGRAPAAGDRVILLDDVFTTGETKEEAFELLTGLGATLAGVVIAVNRQEVGADGSCAIAEFEKARGVPVQAIVTIREIVAFLHGREVNGRVVLDDAARAEMEAYLEQWGA